MQPVRIALVGPGAIGGSVAADLADLSRHSLVVCARTPFERLRVEHPGGTSEVRAPVATDPSEVSVVDHVLLATKAHQSTAAQAWLRALCGPGTSVAVLQNGVDHVERIGALIDDPARVLPVVVQLPAEKRAPGLIHQERNGALFVPDTAPGRAFAELFEGARTRVIATPDFATQAWRKLTMNAAMGGICALVLRSNGAFADPELRALALDAMREVIRVGRAEGAKLDEDSAEPLLDAVAKAAGTHLTSIAVDRREGRALEWEARNAVVGRLGRKHGIPTPLNDLLTTLLRAADEGRGA